MSLFMWKMVGLGVLLALLMGAGLEIRALRAEKGTFNEKLTTANQAANGYRLQSEAVSKNYNALVDRTSASLANLQTVLKGHEESLAAIRASERSATVAIRAIREKTDVQTRAVLDTPLPQFDCVFTRTCATAGPPAK